MTAKFVEVIPSAAYPESLSATDSVHENIHLRQYALRPCRYGWDLDITGSAGCCDIWRTRTAAEGRAEGDSCDERPPAGWCDQMARSGDRTRHCERWQARPTPRI